MQTSFLKLFLRNFLIEHGNKYIIIFNNIKIDFDVERND